MTDLHKNITPFTPAHAHLLALGYAHEKRTRYGNGPICDFYSDGKHYLYVLKDGSVLALKIGCASLDEAFYRTSV